MGDQIKSFDFDITLNKAYKAEDGTMHVVGVASDDGVDLTGDKMAECALDSMVQQAKTKKLPLLDSHHSTFGFGHTHDAHIQKKMETGADGKAHAKREYVVDFALDDRYPHAHDLFKEVESGRSNKQLSIGGHLNRNDPEAVEHEIDKKTGKYARVIKKIQLDHIATTRPKRAAVPGARFLDAIIKSVFDGEAPPSSETIQSITTTTVNASGGDVTLDLEKGVVPVHKYPLDQGSAWSFSGADGDALINKGGWAMFKAAHTWFDSSQGATPQTKGAYKLPHHKLSGGTMKTYRRGVIAAMVRHHAADISAADKAKVRSHLAAHYHEFGMEPPEDKHFVSTEEFIKFHEDQGIKMKWLREEQTVLEKARQQAQAALSGKEAAEQETAGMGDTNVNKSEDAARGLEVLSKIGGLFTSAPPAPSGTPLPEHLQTLQKAIDGVIAKGIPSTATPEVVKMTTALSKFLSGAGIKMLDEEDAARRAAELNKGGVDPKVYGELVEKAVNARIETFAKDLDGKVNAFAEALFKGFEASNQKLDLVIKGVDERCAKLEKLSGVRMSIPGQEERVTKTNPDGTPSGILGLPADRQPTPDKPFRGMFDRVRAQALAKMGASAVKQQ